MQFKNTLSFTTRCQPVFLLTLFSVQQQSLSYQTAFSWKVQIPCLLIKCHTCITPLVQSSPWGTLGEESSALTYTLTLPPQTRCPTSSASSWMKTRPSFPSTPFHHFIFKSSDWFYSEMEIHQISRRQRQWRHITLLKLPKTQLLLRNQKG